MKKNTIYTDKEYMAQGFSAFEVPMIRRHDELFNRRDELTDEERNEMYTLVDELGL